MPFIPHRSCGGSSMVIYSSANMSVRISPEARDCFELSHLPIKTFGFKYVTVTCFDLIEYRKTFLVAHYMFREMLNDNADERPCTFCSFFIRLITDEEVVFVDIDETDDHIECGQTLINFVDGFCEGDLILLGEEMKGRVNTVEWHIGCSDCSGKCGCSSGRATAVVFKCVQSYSANATMTNTSFWSIRP